MKFKRWIAVELRGGNFIAILVDDITDIEGHTEGFLDITQIYVESRSEWLEVYGTVEEIVAKINAATPAVVVGVTQE